jgi:bifunctional non-homologous end joining protein LigD
MIMERDAKRTSPVQRQKYGRMVRVRPMLATAGALPTGPGWAYELKWDGVRVLADRTPGHLHLFSRSEREVTIAYPELAAVGAGCADVLFDGEVVAMAEGRPSFAALASRMNVGNAAQARRAASANPVTYLVFDVLRLYGVDLADRPYSQRRATLERLATEHDVGPITIPPAFDDGPATVEACRGQGLEGVVAKRLDSVYRPGVRSPDWIKVKQQHKQEFVVCGYEVGVGGRSRQIGALVLGYFADGRLRYAGQVGSGLAGKALRDLESRLTAQQECPIDEELPAAERRGVVWCVPDVVVEVAFGNWTLAGRLRFPTYQGLRNDKDAREVVREP